MNFLIVAATTNEIQPLLNCLHPERNVSTTLNYYKYRGHIVHVLITGVGMTATAYHLGKMLSDFYDVAINMGIAGAFDKTLQKGEVVNVTNEVFSELGAEDGDNFLSLEKINLEGVQEVVNQKKIKNSVLDKIPTVKGITVNTVHGNENSISKVRQQFSPAVESMEGAAFLYACVNEGVPCVQLRAISNYVERRNRAAWDIPVAIKNLNETAIQMLNEFDVFG